MADPTGPRVARRMSDTPPAPSAVPGASWADRMLIELYARPGEAQALLARLYIAGPWITPEGESSSDKTGPFHYRPDARTGSPAAQVGPHPDGGWSWWLYRATAPYGRVDTLHGARDAADAALRAEAPPWRLA